MFICVIWPDLYFFLPLFYFELYINKPYKLLYILPAFFIGILLGHSIYHSLFIVGFSVLTAYLLTIIEKSLDFEAESYVEIDQLRYLNDRFIKEQKKLLDMQDERLQSSMLRERRRIIDEIHDTLGHQLSSAVIQIGALEYIVQDDEVRQSLGQVSEVLKNSMQNVRTIIHAERQTTTNLKADLQVLVDNFTKCQISFSYNNTLSLSTQYAHSIVNIAKEALTNINKHSNATHVQLRFTELVDSGPCS